MLLSSCVIWRHRTFEDFREECPGGDPALQALIVERLDEALAWLESLGAPVIERATGNPRTIGMRFDPRGLTDALVRAGGEIRVEAPLTELRGPTILATGGFSVPFAERRGLLLRANPWSSGDGKRLARDRGAALAGDLDEFYGRNLPAPPARITEDRFVELAQLYGAHALVVNERGEEFAPEPLSWSETDLVQATARQPGSRAWYVVDGRALGVEIRGRTVEEMVAAAEQAGGTVRRAVEPRRARPQAATVEEARRVPVRGCPGHARRHAHDRRPASRRPCMRTPRGRNADRRPVGLRSRRRRHRDRRVRERPGAGARPGPRRRRARDDWQAALMGRRARDSDARRGQALRTDHGGQGPRSRRPVGTCVGLLGPNGAGKSTTMRLLTAQAIADEGELEVLGFELPGESKQARALCGVVPQLDNLDVTLTVAQNLLVFTHLYRICRADRQRGH